MEELGIPELDSQQLEDLCTTVEETIRKYIFSKVSSKMTEKLDITVETKGTKPVTLAVDVDISLSPSMKNCDVKRLVHQAVKEAFTAAERYLGALQCRSSK